MAMYSNELDSLVFGLDDELSCETLEYDDVEQVLHVLNINPHKELPSEKD